MLAAATIAGSALIRAQAPVQPAAPSPAQAPATPAGARGRGAPALPARVPVEDYPQRPPADPAVLDRGKALYSVNCAFCHGADARGGDGGGPNLLRSQLVLGDQAGELMAEVVQNGRPGTTMVPIKLTQEQIADIAGFVHSFRVEGYDAARILPATIVVGDAAAGAAAFRSRCAGCHSVTGDLRGFGAKFPDARDLQQMWLMPTTGRGRGGAPLSSVPPTTATVTLPSGQKVTGRLIRVDDFIVTLEQADGMPRSFGRTGDSPRVEIADPLKPHRELLPRYSDKEIHDITAYLVTLK